MTDEELEQLQKEEAEEMVSMVKMLGFVLLACALAGILLCGVVIWWWI